MQAKFTSCQTLILSAAGKSGPIMNTLKPMSTHQGRGLPIPRQFTAVNGEKTFQFQDSLPSLPHPDLANTLRKYLESVKPVVTEEEYQHTVSLVEQFANGIGKRLHEKFLERTHGMRNWLAKWWDEKTYLEYRAPITPYINIGGPAPYWRDHLPPKKGSQVERAAFILYLNAVHWLALRRELIAVDKAGGKPWCMNQYKRLYNSGRRPGLDKDTFHFHFKTETEGDCPSHVTIMCKGRLFSFDILGDEGELLTFSEIERNLQYIRDICDREPVKESLAPLTSTDRTLWAQRYEYLKQLHPDNERHLLVRERSIITMSLEEADAWNAEELLRYSVGGDCTNRWADKATTLFIMKNGTVGSNNDHGPFDGVAYAVATFMTVLMMEDIKLEDQRSGDVRDLPLPEEHVLHVDHTILKAAREARVQYDQACANLDIIQPRFESFGKSWIRSHGRHPDSLVQVALQFAYYRTYGRPAPTYETATLRKYYLARTETVRSCTMEALDWSKAMININCTDQERCSLLLKAIDKQRILMSEAKEMKGCDRHLFALSIIAEEEGLPLPDIYTDQSWTKSGGGGNFILSTSFLGFTPILGGTTAMCEHGYGVFYNMQSEMMDFTVASYRSSHETDSQTFYNTIVQCLHEIRELIDTNHTAVKHKL